MLFVCYKRYFVYFSISSVAQRRSILPINRQSVAPPIKKGKEIGYHLRTGLARISDNSYVSQSLLCTTKKSTRKGCSSVAQRRGFEPPVSFRPTHDFQSCSLNHSDISATAFLKLPIYITVFFQKMQAFLHCFRKNLSIS